MAPRKLPRSKLKRTHDFTEIMQKPEQRKTQPTENVTKNLRISPQGGTQKSTKKARRQRR